ncbi:hypothetical protein OF83DRAFT_167997 [Amylostereum chailletii]|nr:hypothetical protein OF83DRAFT_167997 [Amylostereum chailletii]
MTLSHSTVGRIELGACFALAFYGLLMLQIYTYSQMVWKDPLRTKLFVVVLGLVETFHSGFCIDVVYYLVVTKFKQRTVVGLDPIYWGEMVLLMLSVSIHDRVAHSASALTVLITLCIQILTAFFAHCFFTVRVWHATRRSIAIVIVLAVLAFLPLPCDISRVLLLKRHPVVAPRLTAHDPGCSDHHPRYSRV